MTRKKVVTAQANIKCDYFHSRTKKRKNASARKNELKMKRNKMV